MKSRSRPYTWALTAIIVGGLVLLLFANMAYLLSGKHHIPRQAPSAFIPYRPVTIKPLTRSAPADEAPQPISELAALQEGAYYLSQWASLDMSDSLEPNLLPTPVPDNPGGDTDPIDVTAHIGTASLFPSGPSANTPGSYAIGRYPLPLGLNMGSGFPSNSPGYPGGGLVTTFFPNIPYRYHRPSNEGDDSTNDFPGTLASTSFSPLSNNTGGEDALLPLDLPLNSVFLGAGEPDPELYADWNDATGPEPATGLLLTCALVSSLLLRRIKRRKS